MSDVTLKYKPEEIDMLRESLSIALDSMIELEKRLAPINSEARRHTANDIDAIAALMSKTREQVKAHRNQEQ